jgi:hypothetical protein
MASQHGTRVQPQRLSCRSWLASFSDSSATMGRYPTRRRKVHSPKLKVLSAGRRCGAS